MSGRHVCFYGRGTKLIIPWVEVSSLARTAADNGTAIYLATSGGEVSHALRSCVLGHVSQLDLLTTTYPSSYSRSGTKTKR